MIIHYKYTCKFSLFTGYKHVNAHTIIQLYLISRYFINKYGEWIFLFVHLQKFFTTCIFGFKLLASASPISAFLLEMGLVVKKLSLLRKIEPLNDYFV